MIVSGSCSHALRGNTSLRRSAAPAVQDAERPRLAVPRGAWDGGKILSTPLRQNIAPAKDLDVFTADFDVGAAVFSVNHLVADVHGELPALAAIEQLARADGD